VNSNVKEDMNLTQKEDEDNDSGTIYSYNSSLTFLLSLKLDSLDTSCYSRFLSFKFPLDRKIALTYSVKH
jgi:hypothetical protein